MASTTHLADSSQIGIHAPQYRLPASAHVGRVRLAVSDLKRSMNFYSEVIGLAVLDAPSAETRVARLGPHGGGQVLLELHMGLNVWAAGSPPASERDARLLFWELVLPNKDEVERVKVNLVKAGYPALRTAGAVPAFADPWGITVALVAA